MPRFYRKPTGMGVPTYRVPRTPKDYASLSKEERRSFQEQRKKKLGFQLIQGLRSQSHLFDFLQKPVFSSEVKIKKQAESVYRHIEDSRINPRAKKVLERILNESMRNTLLLHRISSQANNGATTPGRVLAGMVTSAARLSPEEYNRIAHSREVQVSSDWLSLHFIAPTYLGDLLNAKLPLLERWAGVRTLLDWPVRSYRNIPVTLVIQNSSDPASDRQFKRHEKWHSFDFYAGRNKATLSNVPDREIRFASATETHTWIRNWVQVELAASLAEGLNRKRFEKRLVNYFKDARMRLTETRGPVLLPKMQQSNAKARYHDHPEYKAVSEIESQAKEVLQKAYELTDLCYQVENHETASSLDSNQLPKNKPSWLFWGFVVAGLVAATPYRKLPRRIDLLKEILSEKLEKRGLEKQSRSR